MAVDARDPRLRAQLKLHEGYRTKPYKDSKGILTIGVGHNLEAKGLPPGIIEALLDYDLKEHAADLDAALPWTAALDTIRYRVMLDMAFNLGMPRLLGFKDMLAATKAGDFVRASVEMLDSKWADETDGVLDGKDSQRAVRLAEMMLTGRDYTE